MDIIFDQYQIREWRQSDVPSLAKYANNRNIALNLRDGFPHPYGEKDAKAFIERTNAIKPSTSFAIATNAEIIGGIGLVLRRDIHRFSAEIGYWLAEPYWDRGIMTKAVRLVCDWAFTELNLTRIFAEPFAANQASIAVLRNCKFVHEGTSRKSAYKDGQFLDQEIYALVR